MEEASPVRYALHGILVAAAAALAVAWVLVPIAISVLYAFSTPQDYYDPNKVIPIRFTLEHVRDLLALGASKAAFNSVVVAVLTIVLSFLLGLPAGYAFARFVFPGRDALKLLIVGMRMFPIIVIAVPLATLYIRLGIYDTPLGVALAHTAMALPFVVLVTSSIFAGVPRELEEAGLVFGLNRLGVFLRITLPLALPGLAAAAIFTFIMSWNEVFIASILTTLNRTLPAFILVSAMAAPDFIKFAAGFLIVLPAMVFVFIARRYLIAMWGITLR
ncbi:carbohydrate ABC transporter permease [Hyperthermus butylicus]|uniref:ABC-type sugar transport system, permease n=1 Tax=Hyperthermus butylicus (strain DSM 5456 / JCM 9403 / PLM1-5) TaxID=415426 RepID=A2BJM0_HYPBU|nr:carbohydrate ABC transporter permease [Hyperthermus butylicus]ABM80181.1 ABC-type sugar transport system, permease [Hyperthermus butylicus DSM 5456]